MRCLCALVACLDTSSVGWTRGLSKMRVVLHQPHHSFCDRFPIAWCLLYMAEVRVLTFFDAFSPLSCLCTFSFKTPVFSVSPSSQKSRLQAVGGTSATVTSCICLSRSGERDQVFIGKTSGSSCRKEPAQARGPRPVRCHAEG